MLTQRYMASTKNVPAIFEKIVDGAPPERFNLEHLTGLGFSSSNDRAIIPVLKDIGFLDNDGRPSQLYRDYRDRSRSRQVMSDALRNAYSDLFLIRESGLSKNDRDAVIGKFKSVHGSSERIAELQAMTFFALLALADTSQSATTKSVSEIVLPELKEPAASEAAISSKRGLSLNYRVEIHLPPTRDIEIYNAIFKSLRENLLDE
ncbi:MAG: DUF5343 domain-containing protein [Methylobacteriaceae bacterium]|nr:DUF5343 domain-containing protein [Methylobacteriaceae bacterium]MCC0003412.1 DUF5343 domain-containing protein [Methylobacteriaceae bacterium]